MHEILQPAQGSYFAVLPTLNSVEVIKEWAKLNPSIKLQDDLHVTVIYSRVNLTCDAQEGFHIANPHGFAKFGEYLVLKLIAPSITVRHQYLISCGGTHDFPTFEPHITLAKVDESFDLNQLTEFNYAHLFFYKEFKETLDPNRE